MHNAHEGTGVSSVQASVRSTSCEGGAECVDDSAITSKISDHETDTVVNEGESIRRINPGWVNTSRVLHLETGRTSYPLRPYLCRTQRVDRTPHTMPPRAPRTGKDRAHDLLPGQGGSGRLKKVVGWPCVGSLRLGRRDKR